MRADSPIAQSVERRTVNPQVPGSSPGWRAKILKTHSMRVGFFFVLENIVFDLSQIIFFIIGSFATITLVMMVYPDLFRRKQKFYAKHVITPFERKMFIRLKEAFPRHHVLAQVSFSSLITSDHYKIRAKFNRKVTDFVLLDEQLAVVVIIELDDPSHIGKEQEDAERDAMLNEAGYIVLRFTEIPSIRQLHKHIGVTPAMHA